MKSGGKFRKYIAEQKTFLCFIANFFCVLLIIAFFWFSQTPDEYDKSLKLAVAVFAADTAVSSVIIILGRPAKLPAGKKRGSGDPLLFENITPELVYAFMSPVLITEPGGYIVWHNEAALQYLAKEGEGEIMWRSISDISGNQLSPEKTRGIFEMEAAPETESKEIGANIFINGRYFKVSAFKTGAAPQAQSGELDVYIFSDITEIEYLKYEADMKDPVAAYFIVDNLDEANPKLQDKYRSASGAVSDLLNGFMADCGGLIKEYGKDKYLCFFENRALKNFIRSKFGILDQIRDIKIEELDMPVTISGGVSNIEGSLFEKESAARHALDMALQRGGDQVGVKSASSTEFYGGKTKTVQKRTKVKSRVIADELAQYMKRSSNILIMGHKNSDSDSIGACVGMARFALSLGREVNIVVNIHDPNIKFAFAKLRGFDEYGGVFIDESAALDKITAETFVVVVDVNNPPHFESEAVYKNVYKCAVIDHHRKVAEYTKSPDVEYIEPSASSASELAAEILEQSLSRGDLSKEEAELLLAGIFLDTKNFSRNTGTSTFSAALYLRGEGASPSDAEGMISKTNLEEFIKQARFETNITIYRNLAAISVFEEEAKFTDRNAGAKAAERMLEIEGVAAAFVIYRIEGVVYISARSLPWGNINVQIIMENLGGGGHFEFAGAQLKNLGLSEASALLKKTIDDYFDAK
ncbi:MAG: DHH family phosphoesterase [Oscillospiraceae bacterium]|nr:DHH family phosphoesterase [Oscillospiraceae bacterium]